MATILDLMERYNVKTRQGMVQWAKAHMEEINATGEHAIRVKGDWDFDAEAIKIMDRLRGFGKPIVMKELESDKVAVARQEAENYRILLFNKQEELNQVQRQLLAAKDRLLDMQPLYLEATGAKEKQAAAEKESEQLRGAMAELEKKRQEQERALQEKRDELDRLKGKSFWERLFRWK